MDIVDYLERNAAVWPDRIAYIDRTGQFTWCQVHQRSRGLAAALADRGIRPGDTVASLSLDRIETVETFYACALLGAVRTGVNFRYSPREVRHLLNDSAAKAIVVEAGPCEELFRAAAVEVGVCIVVSGNEEDPNSYNRAIESAPAFSRRHIGQPNDIAAISYTTGSTGLPKGVLWRRAALPEVLVQTWFQTGIRNDDVFLHCLPAAGVPILLATANVVNGHTVVLLDRYDVDRVLTAIEKARVTYVLLVPTMLQDLCLAAKSGHRDLSSLRLVLYGSAPATPALIRDAVETLGCELVQWYGSTEGTGGWYTQLTWADHLDALQRPDPNSVLTTCGRPFLHTSIELRNSDGAPVGLGDVGEVCVRSETLMAGYLNLPDESAAALSDGWLRTGDLARWTAEGYLQLVDRRKFMIITGAYNVYPVVVEAVLAEHVDVAEVCVVGIPDDRWGEAVCAVVVLVPSSGKPNAAETERVRSELFDLARTSLASFELPKRIDFVAELPRGATGKVLKREVWNSYRSTAARDSKICGDDS